MKDDEYYNDWYTDHENNLLEDFLMSFTHEQLRQMIMDDFATEIKELYEERWTEHCNEQFRYFCEDK